MIKYFKIFENDNFKYNVNDYVYVPGYSSNNGHCKILKVAERKTMYSKVPFSWDYAVEAYNERIKDFIRFYIDEVEIKRRLTKTEIEEYKTIKISLKYNL